MQYMYIHVSGIKGTLNQNLAFFVLSQNYQLLFLKNKNKNKHPRAN